MYPLVLWILAALTISGCITIDPFQQDYEQARRAIKTNDETTLEAALQHIKTADGSVVSGKRAICARSQGCRILRNEGIAKFCDLKRQSLRLDKVAISEAVTKYQNVVPSEDVERRYGKSRSWKWDPPEACKKLITAANDLSKEIAVEEYKEKSLAAARQKAADDEQKRLEAIKIKSTSTECKAVRIERAYCECQIVIAFQDSVIDRQKKIGQRVGVIDQDKLYQAANTQIYTQGVVKKINADLKSLTGKSMLPSSCQVSSDDLGITKMSCSAKRKLYDKMTAACGENPRDYQNECAANINFEDESCQQATAH